MDGATSFGRWLRHRRRMLDLTQDELAQRVGCSVVTIRKIETDERRPSKQIAERLAASLDIPLAERPAFLQAARAELAAAGLDLGPPLADRAPPEAAPRPLPSGTVTFLFTDIEGSTQLWEQHPQAMPAALARHNAILQEAITAHGGVVFKTVGDAVHAVFGTAPAALAAALATQRALQAQAWGASGALHVRMALLTGLADERDGDYYGPPLNRAARLLAAGHGQQILISGATQALACDHLPPEMELRDLGTHRLKDLSRPEQIFQLVAPDLPADFPPLRSLDRRASNLPAQPTALIGREREVAAVCQLLRRADVRLLTLSGPGGVGKTRLALQVAAEMLDEFAHGASFVALAPISDPGLVVSTIVQTLGLREVSGQPLLDMLKAYLHPKQRLLLLDNFEQLLAAAPLLADLLTACPQLKLLVTSRAVLHLSGEQAFPVPPLTLPELQQLPPAEADLVTSVSQYEAVRLFIARAQAVKPDFQVTTANAPAVAEICYRLDGLPLAIELAAAWVRLFPPQALLARLSSPLTLLTGGGRDLPERQQTLRQTLDWSYNLLDAGEQILFARLGVFAGGCTLEAAEAVCKWAGDLSVEVLDGLASLMDKSLLQQEEGRDGEPRFTMLETIREYAREQLERSGELDNVQQQHAAYYLALAEQAADRLAIEHDNFRAALQWGLEHDADAGLHLAGTLPVYWQRRGDLTEGRSWLQALLDRVAALPELHGAAARRRQAAQAKALIGLSRTAVGKATARRGWLPAKPVCACTGSWGIAGAWASRLPGSDL